MSAITPLAAAPAPADYLALEEFQSATPVSFDAQPILHAHLTNVKLWRRRRPLPTTGTESTNGNGGARPLEALWPSNTTDDRTGDVPSSEEARRALSEDERKTYAEVAVDVFVGSNFLVLFNTHARTGVQIAYPYISIHAIRNLGSDQSRLATLWLQIDESSSATSHQDDADDAGDDSLVELLLVPDQTSQLLAPLDDTEDNSASASSSSSSSSPPNQVQALFKAISACSDLHPDPQMSDDDEDGHDPMDRIYFESAVGDDGGHGGTDSTLEPVPGYQHVYALGPTYTSSSTQDGALPPPMPGSSGWITAENMHEFFDADGNYTGGSGEVEVYDASEGVEAYDARVAAMETETGGGGDEPSLGEGAGRVRVRDEEDVETTEDPPDAKKPNGGDAKRVKLDEAKDSPQ